MKYTVNTDWKGKMKFDALVNDHHVIMDLTEEKGGEDAGPRPKPLMLAAIAGCTGFDVISILKKMRMDVKEFHVNVEGDTSEEMPNPFIKMHIIYEFKIEDPDMDMIEKAISLSMEKYCGVSYVYRNAGIDITHEIRML